MKLGEARALLAGDLESATDASVAIADYPPDQLAVPALFVLWGTPWLVLRNRCHWDANLDVLLVSTRFDPGGTFGTLDELVTQVLPLLNGDPWRFAFLEAPGPMDVGGVTYLAARLSVAVTLDNG